MVQGRMCDGRILERNLGSRFRLEETDEQELDREDAMMELILQLKYYMAYPFLFFLFPAL